MLLGERAEFALSLNDALTRSKRGRYLFSNLVVQPTPFCNLDCSYCYLPLRSKKAILETAICSRLASDLAQLPQAVLITWHGGEPLTVPVDRFREYLECFESLRLAGRIEHVVQTNACLINDDWCRLFKDYGFYVGVSVDGDDQFNNRRLKRNGGSSIADVLKGISYLRKHEISFTAIAVVGDQSLASPKRLYDFFSEIGCRSFGINFPDVMNFNKESLSSPDDDVKRFWKSLFGIWKENPVVSVREFNHVFAWLKAVWANVDHNIADRHVDLFPTVDCNGNVTLLSPEFVNSGIDGDDNFIVGNLKERSLLEILDGYEQVPYVREFFDGREKCQAECEYYTSCGGGNASAKYFATGSTNATITTSCKRSEMLLMDAILGA